ncbi:MAG: hypothetical protein Q7S91_08050, partial [Aquabacterium sp.]|nr:hypothetical protein [Aquabacterium sp.]
MAVVADGDLAAALSTCLGMAGVVSRPFAKRTDLMHCSKSDAPRAVVLGLPMGLATDTDTDAALQPPWHWDVPVIAVGPADGLDAVELAGQ